MVHARGLGDVGLVVVVVVVVGRVVSQQCLPPLVSLRAPSSHIPVLS